MESQGYRHLSTYRGCYQRIYSSCAFGFTFTSLRHLTNAWSKQHGVTATNALVDVVKFFSDNVFEDLQAASGSVHPILQVDAIRFLYTFRNQVRQSDLFLKG
jgi:hypothetical protein